jgi:hypothetical protein
MRFATWLFLALVLVPSAPARADRAGFEADLAKLVQGGGRVVNRTLSPLADGGRKGVRLDERPDSGLVWFEGVDFANGTIEFEVRGKNVLQKSFVGVAFHGKNAETYEAVYFRPFNFRNDDPVRRSHAVQYISEPNHPWRELRSKHPGVYEKPIEPAPDPDGWLRARVVVAGPKVSVYVSDAKEPCLVVDRLSKRESGRVGLWVGAGSGGDFASFKVTPAESR